MKTVSLNPLDLLLHPNVLLRVTSAWLVGLLILLGAWTASYAWLPAGSLHPWVMLTQSAAPDDAVGIFIWNFLLVACPLAIPSLFRIGRLSGGYLIPWLVCADYGALLGTNSWALPDPAGALAPNLAILWGRAGVPEITAYLLVAAALANVYLWRQTSFWSLQVKRVRSLRDFHLSRSEIVGLVTAVALLGWAAAIEAGQLAQL